MPAYSNACQFHREHPFLWLCIMAVATRSTKQQAYLGRVRSGSILLVPALVLMLVIALALSLDLTALLLLAVSFVLTISLSLALTLTLTLTPPHPLTMPLTHTILGMLM